MKNNNMADDEKVHTGLHVHRYADNPREKALADAWRELNTRNRNGRPPHLGILLDPENRGIYPSERDCLVAATVIQWLGSPVGRSFLASAGVIGK